MRFPLKHAILLLLPFAIAGCDEENVLYTTESEEEIPPPPDFPTDINNLDSPPGQERSQSSIPPPEPVEFAPQELGEPTTQIELVGLSFPVPERYERQEAQSDMRIAQFSVPGGEQEDATLIAFYFGADQGGSVLQNAARWLNQFDPPQGRQSPLSRFHQQQRGALGITRMTLEGTWTPSMMAGTSAPTGPMEDWMMDAVIVEGGPQGTLFLRLTGPRGVAENEDPVMENIAAQVKSDGSAEASADAEATEPAPQETTDGGEQGTVAGLALTVPKSWRKEQPDSRMREAQYALPADGSEEDGEFVAFYFGPDGGGSVEANLSRWEGQVEQSDGTSGGGKALRDTVERDGLTIHTLRVSGTYTGAAMGPMAPAPEPKESYVLHGAIVEGGPEGPVYFRATGPKTVMNRHSAAIEGVLDGLHPAGN